MSAGTTSLSTVGESRIPAGGRGGEEVEAEAEAEAGVWRGRVEVFLSRSNRESSLGFERLRGE